MTSPGRYWLIGASEGLGRALAEQMDKAGFRLVLSARSADRLAALAADLDHPAEIVPLDVCDSQSCRQAAGAVFAAGAPDGIVYLAGTYAPMTASEWDGDKAATIADVNLTGALRILGHVVPEMARRNAGHVVLIGSLAGYRGLPGAIGYGASKAGLMHLAQNLRADLWRTGVRVQVINPGFISTRLTDLNDFGMPMLMTAGDAAAQVLAAMRSNRFRRDFPWPFAGLFRLAPWLPDWLYLRLYARRGGR